MRDTNALTLLELLIVVAIVGLLAAVLIPNLLNVRKNAQYTAATLLLHELAQQLTVCMVNTGDFPADVPRNTAPPSCPNVDWPQPSEIPFGSSVDYENWPVGSGRWVGVTFFGEANQRTGLVRNTDLGAGLKRHVSANNITLSLGLEAP